jgi:hypothetical protein
VQETTQNVVDHSGSIIGGVMSARYFSTTQEVRVAIVDPQPMYNVPVVCEFAYLKLPVVEFDALLIFTPSKPTLQR